MLIVAGLNLGSLKPRVWDVESPHHLVGLRAVMVSYAEFFQKPARRRRAMEQGIHEFLGVSSEVKVYLDNGAYYFRTRTGENPLKEYEEFVEQAKPNWYPVPQDYIPLPNMSVEEQQECLKKTMNMNRVYSQDGYAPVLHISRLLGDYIKEVKSDETLKSKRQIALGGIVPNLLRSRKAMSHNDVLNSLHAVRQLFPDQHIHVFGIGGTATLHIAALLGIDSVDSSGWRNRAARGMIQLPGTGERIVAELGGWRGRKPSNEEWNKLEKCECPACSQHGLKGLTSDGSFGFCNRATHNLWILLEEARLIEKHLAGKTYKDWYRSHLDNTTYLPLIDEIVRCCYEDG